MNNQKRVALAAIAITSVLIMLGISPVSAILPTIAAHFSVDVTTASWVLTSFLLSLTSFLLISGRLGDLYGHRQVFLIGLVIYTVAGTLGGFIQDIGILIAARAIQGIGGAMIAGNSLAIITHTFTTEERGRAIGVSSVASAFGIMLGVAMSTWLAQYLNWQLLFYSTLPLGLVGIWTALYLKIDYRPSERPRVDYLGAILLAIALTAFSLSLSHSHAGEVVSAEGLQYHGGLLLVTVIALILFVAVELRVRQPIVEFSYLRNGPFAFSIVANEILHMTMMSFPFLVPFLLEKGLGLSPVHTAGLLISIQVGNIATAPISGLIYDRTRWRFFCPVAMVFICAGLGVMALIAPTISYVELLFVGLLTGMGLGFFMTPNNTIIMESVPPDLRGFAAGMLETSRQLGHTIGVGASTAIMTLAITGVATGTSQATAYVIGYQHAMLAAAIFAFLGIFASLVHALSRQARNESLLRMAEVN